jgi:hypothetical protein
MEFRIASIKEVVYSWRPHRGGEGVRPAWMGVDRALECYAFVDVHTEKNDMDLEWYNFTDLRLQSHLKS